ncbi:MAG: hypothetical protein IH948_04260 [Bacteroidetes bacterium]|nr:hypothetical protein [Bacteroidota bacterium]
MKKNKNIVKFGSILLGLFGISSLFSSCAKEVTCNCTMTYTYIDNGISYTYSESLFQITTKGKCEDVEIEIPEYAYINSYAGSSYTISCK